MSSQSSKAIWKPLFTDPRFNSGASEPHIGRSATASLGKCKQKLVRRFAEEVSQQVCTDLVVPSALMTLKLKVII